jgi:hypothetical protein
VIQIRVKMGLHVSHQAESTDVCAHREDLDPIVMKVGIAIFKLGISFKEE